MDTSRSTPFASPGAVPAITSGRAHWSAWVGPAVVLWSLAYTALALWWAAGGAGFPFGLAADPEAGLSLFGGLTPGAAPVIAGLGAVATVVAALMARDTGHRRSRAALTAWGVAAALTLAILVPDYRVLVVLAYAPVFLVAAPLGLLPDGVSLLDEFTWPLIHQLIAMAGGLLWAGATVVYRRRSLGACQRCGRRGHAGGDEACAAALRRGRRAVAVAVAVPAVYAETRWAWALGVPLGVSDEFLEAGASNGMWVAGAALASLALAGAALTLGLVMRWGEVFPGWLPLVGGRDVPPALGVVPASLVSVVVTSAGLMFVRLMVAGGPFGPGDWGAVAPELLWPIWGVALGVATQAYHERRRGRCPACGLGAGAR